MITSARLGLDTMVVRDEDVVAQRVRDETVMVSLKTNRFYALNAIGTEIWAMLERPMSMADLCADLREAFDVASETCIREVSDLIEDMRREELVRIVGS